MSENLKRRRTQATIRPQHPASTLLYSGTVNSFSQKHLCQNEDLRRKARLGSCQALPSCLAAYSGGAVKGDALAITYSCAYSFSRAETIFFSSDAHAEEMSMLFRLTRFMMAVDIPPISNSIPTSKRFPSTMISIIWRDSSSRVDFLVKATS